MSRTTVTAVGVNVDLIARLRSVGSARCFDVTELHLAPSMINAADIMATQPAVTVIGDNVDAGLRAEVTETLDTEYPESVVIWATTPTADSLRSGMVAGARDQFDPAIDDAGLEDVMLRAVALGNRRLDRAPAPVDGTSESASLGRVVVVVSPKGGSGKTMLSTNLSTALSGMIEGDLVLVDLDLQFGDDAGALSLSPQYSMADAVTAAHDSAALKAMLTPHESRFFLLAAPPDPVMAEDISSAQIADVLSALRREFAFVIVDTGAGLDESTLTAIEHATDVMFITTNDLAAIQALHKVVASLEALEMTNHRRYYVLNRADSDVGVRRRDIEEVTGLTVDVTIPSTKQVPTSMNQGRAVVEHYRRSSAAKSLGKVAELLLPKERKIWGSR